MTDINALMDTFTKKVQADKKLPPDQRDIMMAGLALLRIFLIDVHRIADAVTTEEKIDIKRKGGPSI